MFVVIHGLSVRKTLGSCIGIACGRIGPRCAVCILVQAGVEEAGL